MKARNLLGTLLLLAGSAVAAAPAKPNIIFILADDYGVAEVGCYGADHYRTPGIDRLAKEGARFTRAFTVPLCGPSRAQIMTGRYGFRTGASNQDATGRMKPSVEIMMPRVLKSAGYITSCIGKWGQLPLGPADFGFDHHVRIQGSGVYWNTQDKGKAYVVDGTSRPLLDKEYMPDVLQRHALDFIARHRERPFYLYYSLSHVHSEILPTPDSAPDSKDLYADNVRYMDKLVGALIDEVDRLGLRERTLIIFLGDNGTGAARYERATIGGRTLAGSKGSMQEGGGMVPMLVRWPGTTPAGLVVDDLVDSSDFFPTFAELAGASLPAGNVIDGRSLAARFRGGKGQPREWVFNQLARMWWVRSDRWKLNQAGEFFDLSDAPFTEKLVAPAAMTPEAAAARRRLQAALDQLNPAGGIPDTGDPSGRHARNVERSKKERPER